MTVNEYRKLWVDALRSGAYKQCRNNLFEDGKYCAQGVGAEVFYQLGVKEMRKDEEGKFSGLYWQFWKAFCACVNMNYTELSMVSDMNNCGATFDQIADWLEAQWASEQQQVAAEKVSNVPVHV